MEYRAVILFVIIILVIGTLSMISVEMIGVIKGYGNPSEAVMDVTMKFLISLIFFITASSIRYKVHEDKVVLTGYYTLILALLGSTFFFSGSAHRWIRILGFSLQPSELAKIVVILIVAKYTSSCEKMTSFWYGLLKPLLIVSPIIALIALEPDLSTSLLVFTLVVLMLYSAGARFSHVALLVGSLLVLGYLSYKHHFLLRGYQMQRLLSFFKGKMSEQVLLAIEGAKSGGLFGKGINLGEIKMVVPVVESDFVMAVIGEELGYIGIVVVLFSYLGLVYSLIKSAVKVVEDSFGKMFIIGYAYLIMLQVMVNIGVSTGILPITGITLPFVSKGGSSLLAFMTGLGVVTNITFYKEDEES